MIMNKVELISCESGDYYVLKYNDWIYYEGHDIPNYIWLKLLGEVDDYIEIKETEITDEEMELMTL